MKIKIESYVGMGGSIKTETWSMRGTAISGDSKWEKDNSSQRRVCVKGLKKEPDVLWHMFDTVVC